MLVCVRAESPGRITSLSLVGTTLSAVSGMRLLLAIRLAVRADRASRLCSVAAQPPKVAVVDADEDLFDQEPVARMISGTRATY